MLYRVVVQLLKYFITIFGHLNYPSGEFRKIENTSEIIKLLLHVAHAIPFA